MLKRTVGFLAAVAICILMAAPAGAATATQVKAVARSGQVFITWKEAPGATAYRVYREAKPLTAATLDKTRLGSV